jgi:hypothetical protein
MGDIYEIEYTYETGDSNGRHEPQTERLEMAWLSKDAAKAALKRIREHYEWYECQYRHSSGRWDTKLNKYVKPEEPEWHKPIGKNRCENESTVILLLDNGEPVKFWPPWCGYFESLLAAHVVIKDDPEMSFVPR